MSAVWLVLSNVPDAATADKVAQALVQERLAACVNQLAPCRSTYVWQGQLEQATEIPLLIKTTAATYPRLEARLRALHPYEVPEIIALPLAAGWPDYLGWVNQQIEE